MDPRRELRLIAAATLLNLTLAALLLAFGGTDVAGTELALRMTARFSFVWFLMVFTASPLRALWKGGPGDWLLARRRALGVVFGISMSIHVGFILRLYALHAPERPPMVTDTDFTIGVPGLVLVALMTLTSAMALRRRLGETAWKRLHTTGLYVVWAIFFLCLVDSVGRKETPRPWIEYHSFIGVLLAAMALRLAALRRTRPA